MSGPKNHYYTLTPEQRLELQRRRERELRRKANIASLRRCYGKIVTRLKDVDRYARLAEVLTKHFGEDFGMSEKISALEVQAESILPNCLVRDDTPLEEAETRRKSMEKLYKSFEVDASLLADEAKRQDEVLAARLEEALAKGFEASFADADLEEDKRSLLEGRLQTLAAMEGLPPSLRSKIHRTRTLFETCEKANLKNFEAVSLLPLEKECSLAAEAHAALEKRYLPLLDSYLSLCDLREVEPIETECSEEGCKILEKATEQLSGLFTCDDEEGYISECLDKVMQEMGYRVVGSRMQQKKNGRRFNHELYTYKDGMVVDVTTTEDGKITMELGAPDKVDRLPTAKEAENMVGSMEDFCVDFVEINKRLEDMGVVVKDRVSHLPAAREYAQIINIEEYEMTEALPEAPKKEEKTEGEILRRRQRKRKALYRAI